MYTVYIIHVHVYNQQCSPSALWTFDFNQRPSLARGFRDQTRPNGFCMDFVGTELIRFAGKFTRVRSGGGKHARHGGLPCSDFAAISFATFHSWLVGQTVGGKNADTEAYRPHTRVRSQAADKIPMLQPSDCRLSWRSRRVLTLAIYYIRIDITYYIRSGFLRPWSSTIDEFADSLKIESKTQMYYFGKWRLRKSKSFWRKNRQWNVHEGKSWSIKHTFDL